MPSDLLGSVVPIPPAPGKAAPGQKRVAKPKQEPDPARDDVEARCQEAVKLVRKVYVRHPNYGDLVRGIESGGLNCLEDRVPVSVGTYFRSLITFCRHSKQAYPSRQCSAASHGRSTSFSLAWDPYLSSLKPSSMVSECKYMRGFSVRKERTMGVADGWRTTTATRSGSGYSVGEQAFTRPYQLHAHSAAIWKI